MAASQPNEAKPGHHTHRVTEPPSENKSSPGVMLLDSQCRVLQVNETVCHLFGYSEISIKGHSLAALLAPFVQSTESKASIEDLLRLPAESTDRTSIAEKVELVGSDRESKCYRVTRTTFPAGNKTAALMLWERIYPDTPPELALQLAGFLDEARMGLLWLSKDGRPSFANKWLLERFGADNMDALLCTPSGESLLEFAAKARDTLSPFQNPQAQTFPSTHGENFTLEVSSAPLECAPCRCDGVAVLFRDRSEHLLLERDLARSQRTLEEFMRHLPAMAFIKDSNGKNIFVNRKIQEILGKSAEECHGKTSGELFKGIDETLVTTSDAEVLKSRQPVINEIVINQDSGIRTFYTLKFPIELDRGQILFGGMAVDITDRKENEARLIENEAKYRLIFEKAGDAIVVLDDKGLIASANPMAYRQYEYAEGALLGLHVSELDTPEHSAQAPHRIQRVLNQGSFRFLTQHRKAGGEIFDVEVNARRFRWRDQVGILCLLRDLSLTKQAEEARLIRSKLEATGVLAGGIAHDFNNLLTTILLSVEMTQLSLLEKHPQQTELLDTAVEAVHAAQELSKRLITFADGGAPLFRSVDLNRLITDATRGSFDPAKTRVTYDLPAQPLLAQVDPGQISQLLHNLVTNANEAMPLGGLLTLRLTRLPAPIASEPDTAEIVVEDNGVGIPAEVLPKIYDPYFSTKIRGEQKGMGLGLTICRSITLQHHGSLSIESKPGEGTKVRLVLPLNQKQKDKAASTSTAVNHRPIHRILVMDDDEFMRRVLDRTLKFFGYECALASRGEEALLLAAAAEDAAKPFDLIILDLMVKDGMGAMDTIKEIKQRWPHTKVLVMSGYADNDALTNFSAHGFVGSLSKPFTNQQLRQLLNEVSTGRANGRLLEPGT